MRPNAVEMIRGLQQTLLMHVLPDLKSPFAQDQVQFSLMLLETLAQEWDNAADNLVRDNHEMRDIFREAVSLIASLPRAARPAELRALVAPLRAAAGARQGDSLVLSTLRACNNELCGLLERLLVACEEAVGNPSLASLLPLRQRIYNHLWEVDCRGWSPWDALSFRGRIVSRRSA